MDTYICAQEETFDGISLKMYGDEKWTGLLMAANGQYAHLPRFAGGEELTLPEVTEPLRTLPPWRRKGGD